MKILPNTYDKIVLVDGRTGTVIEILEEDSTYLVDIDLPGLAWDTIEVRQTEIARVLE